MLIFQETGGTRDFFVINKFLTIAHKAESRKPKEKIMPRWNYQSANEFLVGRRKLHGNIASYTYLERDGDMIVMKYGQFKRGGREIVRLHPDGRIQFTACWSCPSIRDRFNWCIEQYVGKDKLVGYFGNERGHWALRIRRDRPAPDQCDIYSFRDGLTLHPDGTVTDYDPEPFDQKIKNHLKKIRDRNAIHTVKSAGGFTVGDVVFHETSTYDYSQKSGYSYAIVKKSLGPYRIKRIRASMNRTILWLTNLDGSPILQPLGNTPQYQGVSVRYNRFRRDPFLSSVAQAVRNPVTATTIRAILDFSDLCSSSAFLQRLSPDVAAIPAAELTNQVLR